MPQSTHLEIVDSETLYVPEPACDASDLELLSEKARQLPHSFTNLPDVPSSRTLVERCKALTPEFKLLLGKLELPTVGSSNSDDGRWLYENVRLLHSEHQSTVEALKPLRKMPHRAGPRTGPHAPYLPR